jgi:hypothetical protein
MARSAPRRPKGTPENPVRSVRVADALWNKAAVRARHEGVTMSHVLLTFVEGYAEGLVDLPRITATFASPPAQERAG